MAVANVIQEPKGKYNITAIVYLQIINTSFVVLTPTCRARVVFVARKVQLATQIFCCVRTKVQLATKNFTRMVFRSIVASWRRRYYLEIGKRRRAL